MQFSAIAIVLFASLGAIASPIEGDSNAVISRAESAAEITYDGTCNKEKNECNYKGQDGKSSFVKCPTARNKVCTKDGAKCTYDSVDKKVTCD